MGTDELTGSRAATSASVREWRSSIVRRNLRAIGERSAQDFRRDAPATFDTHPVGVQ